MIKPDRIGHVVIKVRDLNRSLEFYTKVLGLDVMNASEIPGVLNIAFLSCDRRDHHELALLEVGPEAGDPDPGTVGMSHFAFRMPDQASLEAAYAELKGQGVPVHFTVNHGVASGVYFFDPDGNELEVYADNAASDFGDMPNPYMGFDKLPFASDELSIIEAVAQG